MFNCTLNLTDSHESNQVVSLAQIDKDIQVRRPYGIEKSRWDAILISYYLSHNYRDAVEELGFRTYLDASNELALLLDVKPGFIKRTRDGFDPFFPNSKVGYYQRPLRPSRQYVFDYFQTVSDDDLSTYINWLVEEYKSNR